MKRSCELVIRVNPSAEDLDGPCCVRDQRLVVAPQSLRRLPAPTVVGDAVHAGAAF